MLYFDLLPIDIKIIIVDLMKKDPYTEKRFETQCMLYNFDSSIAIKLCYNIKSSILISPLVILYLWYMLQYYDYKSKKHYEMLDRVFYY